MLRLEADIEYDRYIATECNPTVLLDSYAEVYIPKVPFTVGFCIGCGNQRQQCNGKDKGCEWTE
jgi:hypothetical protein